MRKFTSGKLLPVLALALPLTTALQAQAEEWVALGYAITDDEAAVSVSEPMPTRAEAEEWALDDCAFEGLPGCTIAIAFNTGCGYITTGRGPEGTTGFAVGWGATEEAVTANCLSQGAVSCDPPVGDCVD